jgi:hypothetical protein
VVNLHDERFGQPATGNMEIIKKSGCLATEAALKSGDLDATCRRLFLGL